MRDYKCCSWQSMSRYPILIVNLSFFPQIQTISNSIPIDLLSKLGIKYQKISSNKRHTFRTDAWARLHFRFFFLCFSTS